MRLLVRMRPLGGAYGVPGGRCHARVPAAPAGWRAAQPRRGVATVGSLSTSMRRERGSHRFPRLLLLGTLLAGRRCGASASRSHNPLEDLLGRLLQAPPTLLLLPVRHGGEAVCRSPCPAPTYIMLNKDGLLLSSIFTGRKRLCFGFVEWDDDPLLLSASSLDLITSMPLLLNQQLTTNNEWSALVLQMCVEKKALGLLGRNWMPMPSSSSLDLVTTNLLLACLLCFGRPWRGGAGSRNRAARRPSELDVSNSHRPCLARGERGGAHQGVCSSSSKATKGPELDESSPATTTDRSQQGHQFGAFPVQRKGVEGDEEGGEGVEGGEGPEEGQGRSRLLYSMLNTNAKGFIAGEEQEGKAIAPAVELEKFKWNMQFC